MFTVRAPNRAHNRISAGVRFTAGVGETDNPAALAYFRKAGYAVEYQSPPAPEIESVPAAVAVRPVHKPAAKRPAKPSRKPYAKQP